MIVNTEWNKFQDRFWSFVLVDRLFFRSIHPVFSWIFKMVEVVLLPETRAPMKPFYLMESDKESERLQIKSKAEKTREQLIDTGILSLEPGAFILDAGSGIGHAAEVIGDLLGEHGLASRVALLDQSEKRLAAARARMEVDPKSKYDYIPCDLTDIPLESDSADYIFCRFVFEYLQDPQAVFDELFRVLKPGGKLVLGDLDYNCMTHYPMDPQLEADLNDVMKALQDNQFFDPFMGRKIYSYFYRSGLNDIRVNFYAHHLFYGVLAPEDEFNWLAKLDRLIELEQKGTLKLKIDVERFKKNIHEFVKFPGRFSYTPLILVEGTKRHD